MTDLTPEHTSRQASVGPHCHHPEVAAAYKYVHSVLVTADAQSPAGGYAWHGWALREAFLAGCTHARARALLDQSEPEGLTDKVLLGLADEFIDGDYSGTLAFARAAIAADRACLGHQPRRLRNCPTHGQQPPEAWGCPECVMELRKELTALQQPPAGGEVGELQRWELRQRFEATLNGARCLSDRPVGNVQLADRLLDDVLVCSTSALQPVAVSERLPVPEDCDEQGQCWWFDTDGGRIKWVLCGPDEGWTHWLPFNALPIPQGMEAEA